MSRATNDVARMLALVPWLLERPGASLEEIAGAFDTTPRAVRRDLEHLDFCGLPGLGGGALFDVDLFGDRVVVRMADELRRPLRPTPSEALRLVLTVDAVTDLIGDEIPALRTAVAKVRTALGLTTASADVIPDQPTGAVAVLRQAIDDGTRVRLRYQGRADATPRTRLVDPWALRVEDGLWYLHGFDVDVAGERVFRLDRVAVVEPTVEPVTSVRPDDALEAPRYRPSGDDVRVVLTASGGGRWIEEAVDVESVHEHDDGSATIALLTDAPAWIARLVLMAAGQVKVEEPADLAAKVIGRARQGLAEMTNGRAVFGR